MKRKVSIVFLLMVLLAGSGVLVFGTGTTDETGEPVTIRMIGRGASVATTPGRQADIVAQEIERILNINWDYTELEGDAVQQTIVASGDLPDILQITIPDHIEPLIEAENILELGQHLDKLPNMTLNASIMIDYSREYLSAGTGDFYAVLNQVQAGRSGGVAAGPWLRMDYLEELGYPEMNSPLEVLDVLAEMQRRHPENEDGQKVWGVTMWHDWGLFGYVIMHNFYKGLHNIDANRLHFVNMANWDEIVHPTDDDHPIWLDGKFYNRAHQMGLLDPETFTQNYDNALQKINGFRILAPMLNWTTYNPNTTLANAGGKGYVHHYFPDTPEWTYLVGANEPFGSSGHIMVVSSKTKVLDAALKFLDFIYSDYGVRVMQSGKEGLHWNYENNKPVPTQAYIDEIMNNPDFMVTAGIRKWTNWKGLAGVDSDGYPFSLASLPEIAKMTLLPFQKEYLGLLGYQTEGEQLDARVNQTFHNGALTSFVPMADEEVQRVGASIANYLHTALAQLWLAESDEQYEGIKAEIIAELKKLGIEEQSKYWEGAFAEARNTYAKFN